MPAADTSQDPSTQVVFLTSAADLGHAVRAGRKRSGETQEALARRCRVGRRFVLDLEAGKPGARLDLTLQVIYGVGFVPLLVPQELIRAAMGK